MPTVVADMAGRLAEPERSDVAGALEIACIDEAAQCLDRADEEKLRQAADKETQGRDQDPRHAGSHLPRSYGQVGLVHLIDLHVVDLVYSDDESVRAQERDDAGEGARQENPPDGVSVLEEDPRGEREGRENRAPNGVGPGEFPHRLQEAGLWGGSAAAALAARARPRARRQELGRFECR